MKKTFAFAFASAFGLVATFGSQACNGLALDDRPCPCTTGWVCCGERNVCVPNGASCNSEPVDSGALDADVSAPPPDIVTPPPIVVDDPPTTTQGTLAQVPLAFSLACSPDAIYTGTTDGKIFAVPLTAPTPTEVVPAPSGKVGYLAWSDGHLFYTLPAEGEVHARDLGGGGDLLLTSNQPHPMGITVSGADVFFASETQVARLAKDVTGQTASPRVVFSEAGHPQPRGGARGLALSGLRFVVAHAPVSDGLSGALGTYLSTGEQLSFYTFFSRTIGVAASPTRTYWSESDGTVRFGPKPIASNGLSPIVVVSNQILLGDICIQGSRLYFTATNDDDVREIRYVGVE